MIILDTPQCTIVKGAYQETLALCEERGGVDLLAFSPPYADARTYGMDCAWTDADYADLGDHCFRALRPGGWALVNVSAPVRDWTDDGRGTERGLHAYRLLLDWHDRIGFRVPDVLVFGRHGQPGHFAGFRCDWEPLWWFQRPGEVDRQTNAADVGEVADARNFRPNGALHRLPTGEIERQSPSGFVGVRRRGNLWDYGATGNEYQSGAPDIARQNHPARWPYKLARDIVLCFSDLGMVVCDPFCGAGTTAAAAMDNGRRFIGGDLGERQDHPDNERRGLSPKPWAAVTAEVLAARGLLTSEAINSIQATGANAAPPAQVSIFDSVRRRPRDER